MIDFTKIESSDLHAMCLRGDESAWEYIFNYVLCVARDPRWRLTGPNTPEDIAQDVVCRLLTKGIEQVKNKAAFRSFVRTVAINFIRDSFKKKQVLTRSMDNGQSGEDNISYDPPSNEPGPEDELAQAKLIEALGEAVNELPDKCRLVLSRYLDYKMGLFDNLAALAETFGEKVGTFSSSVKRCLDKLRCVNTISVWLEG